MLTYLFTALRSSPKTTPSGHKGLNYYPHLIEEKLNRQEEVISKCPHNLKAGRADCVSQTSPVWSYPPGLGTGPVRGGWVEFTSLTLESRAFQVRFLEHLQKAQPRTSGLGGAEPWSSLTQARPWGGRAMVGGSFCGT